MEKGIRMCTERLEKMEECEVLVSKRETIRPDHGVGAFWDVGGGCGVCVFLVGGLWSAAQPWGRENGGCM
jgi:hypothetical protein